MKIALHVFRILLLENRKTFPIEKVFSFPFPVLNPHSPFPFPVLLFTDGQKVKIKQNI